MKKRVLSLAAITFMIGATSANALTINYDDGALQNTSGLADYNTNGSDMDGMTIDITYANTSINNTVTFDTVRYDWKDLGSGAGGVDFASGSLELSGSSWSETWELDVTKLDTEIASIFIDAGAGDAVFDVLYDPIGSANSGHGWAFNASLSDITASYSGAVGIAGADPFGDLYRYLTIDFFTEDSTNYFGADDTLIFYADTDSLSVSGDINPVPEPSTVLLFGLGLTALVGYSRKRNSNKYL